jgi:hypothetical protein
MQTYALVAAGIVAFIIYTILKSKASDEPLKPAAAKRIGVTVSVIVAASMVFILIHQFKHWGIF